MINSSIVIGIDGGGTKTIGRLADNTNPNLIEYYGGPANMQVSGASSCVDVFHEMISKLCNASHIDPRNIRSIVIGMAGAGRRSDRETIHTLLEKKLNQPEINLTIVSDADIALEAAYGDQAGVIVIAGTGSIVYGRNDEGIITRAGGWGPLLGDPGSGTDIGIKALQKLCLIFDKRIEKSELFFRFNEFGIDSPESLIKKVYVENLKPSLLTSLVFETATNGDENALDILNRAAEGIINLLIDYLSGYSTQPDIPITLKGGLLENDTIYRRMVLDKLNKLPHNLRLNHNRKESIDGAVSMALRLTSNLTN